VFVVDDLLGWLIGRLADAGYQKLATLVRGSDQARALKAAVTAAVQATVTELGLSDPVEAEQAAEQINKAFRRREPVPLPPGQPTLLEALQAGIAWQLRVVNDAGQPTGSLPGVPVSEVAAKLTTHLVRQIQIRGSQPGPLTPLADQLNHELTRLQGQRIEGVLAQLVDQVAKLGRPGAPVAPGKPVRLAPRPAFLAGREDLLADLDARLRGDGSGPQVVVLSGLGGAGKTSVAVEYAHRHVGQVELAWQFPAEDATVLRAGFADLAAQLGIGAARGRDLVASVHSVLASSPAGWLLVFDNAPDSTSVAGFLPPAGPGQVLVTSRNALWPRQLVEVPVLDTGAAAGFLAERTSDPDRQAAEGLAGELGGLPLALEQAGAYIQATGDTLAAYLAEYERRRADLLLRGGPAEYAGTVATTWALAFTQLEQDAPKAAGLLRLLAYCAPEAIPLRLLLQPRPGLTKHLKSQVAEMLVPLLEDDLAAKDAVAALRRYSLARPAGDRAAGDRAVTVHRLVQAVTADQMPADLAAAWRAAAAAVIEAALPTDPQDPKTWALFASLLPHAQAALTDDSDGMGQVAAYLGESGSYTAARDLYQRVSDARAQGLGAENRDALIARASLSYYTGEAGNAAGARDQSAALVPVCERVLGAEDPATLGVRANLARWTGEAGDAAGARDQYAALLPVRERVSGAEDPATLRVRANLANSTGEAGDPAAARDLLAALLPVREQVLGPEYPDTLLTRRELAAWTGEAGDAVGARDQYVAVLPVLERVLGPEHPGTLVARASLAHWTGKAGDAAAARSQYAALLPVLTRIQGPEHPDTLSARATLAHWTGEAGDAAAARDQYAALLPVQERVVGPEHPSSLASRAELARWTRKAGNDVDTGAN